MLIMQSGLKGPGQHRLAQPEKHTGLIYWGLCFCILGLCNAFKWGCNKPKSQQVAEGVRQALCRCFYSCLLASSLLTLPSIDLIQLRLFFQPLLHCGNNCFLMEEKRMACQGQSCALISDHRWSARLTPVPFTPEASWHHVCVRVLCFLSCLPLPFVFHCRGQPSETAYTIHTSSITPQTWLR